MQKDNRTRNLYFDRSDIARYVKEYAGALSSALNKVDGNQLNLAHQLIKKNHSCGGRIFVGGNGGSAAISDHLCCDFVKGVMTEKHSALQVKSLVADLALTTAIANDIGFDAVFSFQLKAFQLTSKDVVILISSSGHSANILEAVKFAKQRCAPIIGLTGFEGGELRKDSDISLHIPYNNYGVVEDAHQALMHILAQYHYVSLQNV